MLPLITSLYHLPTLSRSAVCGGRGRYSGRYPLVYPPIHRPPSHPSHPRRRWFSSTTPTLDDGPIIGIDLGTTNSCVAVLENGTPVVLENDGKRTTPSVFAVDKDGNRLIGYPALRQMVVNHKNTFFSTKRLIGRRFNDPETKYLTKQVPFSIVAGPNGDAWVADERGKKYSPEQVAANVLIKLKEAASDYLGCTVERAVITVPAYFDNHQRQATEAAGRIAGLRVERIINEPTAAALAYGISRDEEKLVAVYDLGGGTFDISILELGDGIFQVKSTSGDTFLGGEDFNSLLIHHIVTAFEKKEKVSIWNDKIALQRVREAAEVAKHTLSTLDTARVSLPYLAVVGGVPKNFEIDIQRSQYEQMADELIRKSLGPCKKALEDAGLSVNDITDVILVGGMTRMPKVREYVKNFFGKEPYSGINPDEAVAVGAALQGGIISNKGLVLGAEEKEIILLDVTPLNLGTSVHTGEMVVIIPAQTPIPCTKTHTFTTVSDFQTSIKTPVYQGNRPIAKENRLLGEYVVHGVPPAPAGIPKIDVTFTCSANGTVTATSRDRAAGVDHGIVINSAGGLSEAEIERMRREAQLNEEADKKKCETLHLKERARKLISTTDDSIVGLDSSHVPILKSKIQSTKASSNELQSVLNKPNVPIEEIEKKYKAFEEHSKNLLTEIYNLKSKR